MESIIRNVRDIDCRERQAFEHVLGRPLLENQQIIIQVVTMDADSARQRETQEVLSTATLPDWCNVFDGLTDAQIAEIEAMVLQRSNLSRPTE